MALVTSESEWTTARRDNVQTYGKDSERREEAVTWSADTEKKGICHQTRMYACLRGRSFSRIGNSGGRRRSSGASQLIRADKQNLLTLKQ